MFKELSPTDRLQLIKFVCSFAWADLEVQPEERAYVLSLIKSLELDEEEAAKVQGWLMIPPLPEEVDPSEIPMKHRKIFLAAVQDMIAADGSLAVGEVEYFALFEQILGEEDS